MTALPLDQDARDAAAGALEQNVIVLAGAGTGKTHLLIDRLTLLILGKEIPVEKIVALTFTKKAGEEMRERLEKRLRGVIEGTAPKLLEELFPAHRDKWGMLARKALDDIPKAQIGTIHSFAAHLLRLYPLQAGVDPSFREDEGTLFESIFEREWMSWLKEELGASSRRATFWKDLLREIELADLKSLAVSLASPLTEVSDENSSLSIKEEATSLKEKLERLLAQVTLPSPQRARVFHEGLKAWESILAAVAKGQPISSGDQESLKALKCPESLKERSEEIKKLQQRTMALSAVDESLLERAAAAVLPFVKHLRGELNRKGCLSFEGLLVFARNLLKNHPDVRTAIKKRFETFLVDEFQDTDPVQGEILFYLSESELVSASDWKKVKLKPGRLFVVGDPKQSIYRFRGAEMAAFEAFQDHMVRDGAMEVTLSSISTTLQSPISFSTFAMITLECVRLPI